MLKAAILHILAKIIFVMSAYLIHFALGRSLAPASYGVVGLILTLLNFLYLFFSNGVRMAAAKTLSERKYSSRDVVFKSLAFQLGIAAPLFACCYFGAGAIAHVLNDQSLVPYIRMLSWFIPFAAIYFLFLGFFNGLNKVATEAAIACIYPCLKLAVIPFSLFLFADAVRGAISGYLFAVASICVISLLCFFCSLWPLSSIGEKVAPFAFFKTVLGYFTLFSVITLVRNLNTTLIKAILSSDEMVGYYTGAVTLGQVPYMLLAAFYAVLLPMVTRHYAEGNLRGAAAAIQNLLAIVLALVLPIPAIVAASSRAILASFYSAPYAAAGTALSFQIFAETMIGLAALFCTAISATGAKMPILYAALFMLISQAAVGAFAITRFGIAGAAFALLFTGAGACAISYFYMKKNFGKILSRRIVCLLLAAIPLFLAAKALFSSLPGLHLFAIILLYALLYLAYILILVLLKIINIKEIIMFLKKE